MEKKEIITEEEERKTHMVDLEAVSLSELLGIYKLICEHRDLGFGRLSSEAKKTVSTRLREVESALNRRIYGHDIFAVGVPQRVVEGAKPEDIDLDRFVVAKSSDEPADEENEKPETFVVVKNKTESEGE